MLLWMNKIYCWRKEKGVCIEHQNGFCELLTKPKTDSCKAWMYVYLARISKEMHMNCDVSICPIPDTYVGMQSCIPGMRWWWCGGSATSYPNEVLGSIPQTWLSGLALSHVLRLTLSARQKYSCTVRSIGGLQHAVAVLLAFLSAIRDVGCLVGVLTNLV